MKKSEPRVFLPDRDELVGFGLIINQWANFENTVEDLIAGLLDIPNFNGRLFTSGMSYLAKRDLLLVMIEQQYKLKITKGSLFFSELDQILKEAEFFLAIRNCVAHSMWLKGTRKTAIKPARFRARGKLLLRGHSRKERDYTSEELIGIGLDINSLALRLRRLEVKYKLSVARTASQKIFDQVLLSMPSRVQRTPQSNPNDPPKRGKPRRQRKSSHP